MSNADYILSVVQKYFDLSTSSPNRSDNIERGLLEVINWMTSKKDFLNVEDNYKFVTLNVLPLWNEVMGESVESRKIFMVHEVVFDLLACLPLGVIDTNWLKIKCKISLKYAGKLIFIQKYEKAETCLDFVEKQIQEVFKAMNIAQMTKTPSGVAENPAIIDAKRDLLIVCLYRIEIHSFKENYVEAKNYLQKMKAGLVGSLDDVGRKYAAALCFNNGLSANRQEQYKESIFWLTHSYEFGETNAENFVSTLILLAESHMMLDTKLDYENAIVALNKVDCENKGFETNLMKLKAYVGSESPPDEIRKAVLHCYKTIGPSEDNVLQIFYVLQRCKQKCLLHEAMLTFESTLCLSQIGKIFRLHLELLLNENLLTEADEVVKGFINALTRSLHTTDGSHFSEAMLMLVENQGVMFKEKSMFSKAACWFDYCIEIANNFGENTADLRKLKLYQQKCSCLLEMGCCDEARDMLRLAEEQLPQHIISKYLRCKLCIIQNDENEAISVIESFDLHPNTMDDLDDVAKILVLCAEFGVKKLRIKTTMRIFESVIGKLSSVTSTIVALKCVIRLKLQIQSKPFLRIDRDESLVGKNLGFTRPTEGIHVRPDQCRLHYNRIKVEPEQV